MVAPDDFVGHVEGGEIVGCRGVALSGAGKELKRVVGVVVAVFTLAEVAERDQGDVVVLYL